MPHATLGLHQGRALEGRHGYQQWERSLASSRKLEDEVTELSRALAISRVQTEDWRRTGASEVTGLKRGCGVSGYRLPRAGQRSRVSLPGPRSPAARVPGAPVRQS